MRQKEIEIEGKKYTVKEIGYVQALELDGLSKAEMARKLFEVCAGLTKEQMDSLTIKEGKKLQEEINLVNSAENFQ